LTARLHEVDRNRFPPWFAKLEIEAQAHFSQVRLHGHYSHGQSALPPGGAGIERVTICQPAITGERADTLFYGQSWT
jgi:hypothetical protein